MRRNTGFACLSIFVCLFVFHCSNSKTKTRKAKNWYERRIPGQESPVHQFSALSVFPYVGCRKPIWQATLRSSEISFLQKAIPVCTVNSPQSICSAHLQKSLIR